MAEAVLKVQDLHTHFITRNGVIKAVTGVNFELNHRTILCVVGESGSGKSATAHSILRVIPNPGRIVKGAIYLEGVDLLRLGNKQLRNIRGKDISMTLQDPHTALDPSSSIGDQLEETLRAHVKMSRREAWIASIKLLEELDLPDAPKLMERYPFQISGGMSQRVVLAIALAHNPKVLIADEPTSSLDLTVQASILEQLRKRKDKYGTSIVLITHDMGIVAKMADQVAVMYAGSIVEYANRRALFQSPSHPYTWGLLESSPKIDSSPRVLRSIRGSPPSLLDPADQCPFLVRCPKATSVCRLSPRPQLKEVEPNHYVACYNEIRYD